MEIIRDDKGRIVRIIKEESDGDINVIDAFKIEADKEIAKEKEITTRQKNRCDFWKDSIPNIANSIATALINQIETNDEKFSVQELSPMPPYEDQEIKH